MTHFDWKTEEENHWESELTAPMPPRRRRWPWRALLATLVTVAVLLLFAHRQINQQLAATTADVQAEVIAAHNFLMRTAGQRDVELLKSLVSGRNTQWWAAQQQLVEDGWFANPPLLGWTAVAADLAAAENITVTLAPDLNTAELQAIYTYQALNGRGVTETVRLQQTAVYRRGADRWLLAPPEADFWGDWELEKGQYVTLIYPARDRPVAARLGPALDQLVDDICRQLEGITCSPRPALQVWLEKDAQSVLYSASTRLEGGRSLELPTPSLVGLPVDEAGFQALLRVYGTPVATAVISEQVGYQCCRWLSVYQALLDRQLHQLGLKPWPLTPAVYDRLFREQPGGRLDSVLASGPVSSEIDQLRRYAFVAFLEQEVAPGAPLAEAQRALAGSVTTIGWLRQIIGDQQEIDLTTAAFWQFQYRQTTFASLPPPIAWPAAQIQMICNAARNGQAIYSFDLETRHWQQIFHQSQNPPSWLQLTPLASEDLYLLSEQLLDGSSATARYTLMKKDAHVATFDLPVHEATNSSIYMPAATDPNGRFLLMRRYHRSGSALDTGLLDLDQCRTGACELRPVNRWVSWSPHGTHTLLAPDDPWQTDAPEDVAQAFFYRGDNAGRLQRKINNGVNPFWLSDERYGYFRLEPPGYGSGELTLVTAVVGQDFPPRPLLTTGDLRRAVPAAQRPEQFWAVTPMPDRQQPTLLLIRARPLTQQSGMPQTYFFMVELSPALDAAVNVQLFYQTEEDAYLSPSPNGRWFILYERGSPSTTISLLHRETGVRRLLPNASLGMVWSPDGNWLVGNADNRLRLSAPDYDYEQIIYHDLTGCYQTYWVE